MNQSLEEEKKKLELKKSRLDAKEKKLKEKERKIRTRRLIELGGLVAKSGIEDLNNNELLGALLEIHEARKDEAKVKKWKEKGAKAFEKEHEEKGEALVVTFDEEPERDIKSQLRDLGFSWNRFRKEWYGYGKEEEIKKMFSNAKIEKVE
ncbi:MAG: conjugal transfer protein TraD [Simkania sp.]|nr:conjugal transfer protein TraD [Simkania sp.]